MYKVIHDFVPEHAKDIALNEGDRINHVKDLENGWLLGHNVTTGETGTFPATYITKVEGSRESDDVITPTTQEPHKVTTSTTPEPHKSLNVRDTRTVEDTITVKGPQEKTFPPYLRYRVLHNYEPTHRGDITVSEGDLIDHVRDLGNGWILGYNISTGKTGTFPASYIDPAHSVDEPEKPKSSKVEHVFETFQPRKLDSDPLTTMQAKENVTPKLPITEAHQKVKEIVPVLDEFYHQHPEQEHLTKVTDHSFSEREKERRKDGDHTTPETPNTGKTKVQEVVAVLDEFFDGRQNVSGENIPTDNVNESTNINSQITDKGIVPIEHRKTVHFMPDPEVKSYQPANDSYAYDNGSSLRHRLLKSRANEYRCIKAVLGLIVGVVASVALFILLVYVYNYSYEIAGYITLGLSLFIMAGLAMSIYMRCVMLLMLPSLSSSKGRTAFLSLIYGLLLSGPVVNISTNAVQVSESLACATDVIYNQTLALKHQLEEPIIKIADELEKSFKSIEATAEDIVDAFEPIESAVESFISAISDAASALEEVAKKCKSELSSAQDSCESGINSAKSSCEEELDKYDITDDIINVGKEIFGKRRRKRDLDQFLIDKYLIPSLEKYNISGDRLWNTTGLARTNSTRHRRGVLSTVCNILDVSSACTLLSDVSVVCDPFTLINSALTEAADLVKKVLAELSNFFNVSVDATFSLSGGISASQTASNITNNVAADIEDKTDSLTSISSIVTNILGLTLILLFFTSAYYLRKYLSKDYYDNIYITSEFRHYDEACKMEGKESVLPLRRREKRKYIVTLSPLLSMKELAKAKKGFATVFLHFIITALVIFFNYVLYYLLNLVSNYGGVAVISSGVSYADVSVSGSGIIAEFVKVFVDKLDLNMTFEADFNFTVCLPNPSEPSSSDIPVFMSLYFVLLVLLIVQAYGYRIRRKIAAFYFPEQEQTRVVYLHEKIRYKRKTILSWLKQVIVSKLRGKEPKNRITLRGMLMYKHRRLGKFFNFCFPPKKGCVSCDVIASTQVKLHKCKEPSCKAVYCDECYKVMKDTCLICETKREVNRRLKS